ncbi:MAG: V-type ATP synthase subunit D [Anaerolineae bacterium]|nr:V-type ATP synthase subunit D [Anaerolineales bacterium]MCQ3975098.1 V-type ATP synthase subunit D [Anaerolineae bacterium]
MEQIRATRAQLLAKKKQILLARQGRDLLKQKRNALLKELMRLAEQVVRSSDELEQSVGEAVAALALAQALDGPEAVQSAALAARGQISLTVNVTNIMGVLTPVIEQKSLVRGPLDRGYSLNSVSSRVEAAAEAFESQLELIIELASSEMRLRRLAEEIGRTTRRVNALENVLIPRLESQRNYIQMVLEEREREDLFRLKRVKLKLERRARA